MNVTISGFYDEITPMLKGQIAVMKELGEHYMCPRLIDGKNIANFTLEEFKANVYPVLQENDIHFSSIGSPIGKIDIDDEAGYEKQKKQLTELVKIAQLMECKYIRVFSFFYGNRDPYSITDKVIEKMRGFLEIAKDTGVTLIHENEKKIYGDVPDRVMNVYNALHSEGLELCYDASNYVQCDVDPTEAFDMLVDKVVYFHVKDCSKYKVEVPLGTGLGNYEHIFSVLKQRGYTGFFTLEPHTAKYSKLKMPIYLIPCMPLILNRFYKAFRQIDRDMGRKLLQKASTKEVFLWQYNNLKKFIEKVGL